MDYQIVIAQVVKKGKLYSVRRKVRSEDITCPEVLKYIQRCMRRDFLAGKIKPLKQ